MPLFRHRRLESSEFAHSPVAQGNAPEVVDKPLFTDGFATRIPRQYSSDEGATDRYERTQDYTIPAGKYQRPQELTTAIELRKAAEAKARAADAANNAIALGGLDIADLLTLRRAVDYFGSQVVANQTVEPGLVQMASIQFTNAHGAMGRHERENAKIDPATCHLAALSVQRMIESSHNRVTIEEGTAALTALGATTDLESLEHATSFGPNTGELAVDAIKRYRHPESA